MITTVLIDVDDTLLDFTLGERIALRLSFEQLSLPFDPVYASIYHDVNETWWRRYDMGEATIQQVLIERFVDLFRRIGRPMPLQFAGIYEENLRAQHAFVLGAKGFLSRLRAAYRVYAVSNGRASVQERRLCESGLDRMVDGVFVSETIGFHKPQPQFFEYIAQSVDGYSPATTVIVGDSLSSDIAGGVAAGIRTVWYNRFHKPLVGDSVPDFTSDDFHAIERYIASL